MAGRGKGMTPTKLLVLQVREPTQAVDGDDAHVQSHIHGPLSAKDKKGKIIFSFIFFIPIIIILIDYNKRELHINCK